MDIEYPGRPTRKSKITSAVRAAAEQVPWIGPALATLGPFIPDGLEADRDRWEREVTDQLNLLARVQRGPQISRDSVAWLLALLAGRMDSDGTGDVFVSHEDWEARFPEAQLSEIEEALSDLSDARWIQTQADMNSASGVGGFLGTSLLFAHTHPWVHRLYPIEDARILAEYALENYDREAGAISAMEVGEHFGWERKRLYPALAFLADEIVPEESLERQYQPAYPFVWLRMSGSARRAIRQFLEAGAS